MKRFLVLMLLIPLIGLAGPDHEDIMRVKGLVLNQHNEPLPHADVTLKDDKGKTYKLSTDEKGEFELDIQSSEENYQLVLCVNYVSYESEQMRIDWKKGEEKLLVKLKPGYQPIISPANTLPSYSKSNPINESRNISVFIPY